MWPRIRFEDLALNSPLPQNHHDKARSDYPDLFGTKEITGWWFEPPLKNISQLGWLFPIDGKIKMATKPPTRNKVKDQLSCVLGGSKVSFCSFKRSTAASGVLANILTVMLNHWNPIRPPFFNHRKIWSFAIKKKLEFFFKRSYWTWPMKFVDLPNESWLFEVFCKFTRG